MIVEEVREILKEYEKEIETAGCEFDREKAQDYAFRRIHELFRAADQEG